MSNKKDIFKDERFAHLLSNPRFKQLPKKEGKVKIDDRFKPMFENDKFNIQYNVDKYGRKVNKKSVENLKNYYDLDSNESSDEEKAPEKELSDEEVIPGNAIIKGGNKLPETLKDKLKNLEIDYIRGEGVLQSDSSDEEESSSEEEVDVQHDWGELDKDAERTEDSTRRIACLHMDWDRIRAIDIMVLCNSFIPSGAGSVLSVNIYPSEFGKQRLAEEEIKGPKEITTLEPKKDEDENEEEEDEKYTEKLREYQLNRLKYYYAVVEFDSEKSADIVYKECDGLEYESTANRLDLRFIPDDMEFDDEPKDTCTELPDLAKYEPRIFFTTALQHAKVELTWDETDVGRQEISDKLFTDKRNEVSDRELRKFVAFSSESENDDDEEESNVDSDNIDNASKSGKSKIDLYKALLDEVNQKEEEKKKQQVEMEYSWGIGSLDKKKEQAVETQEELTPFEKILEKKKLKKKAKKEQRKKKLKGGEDENENGYSSSDFDDIDMNDPYFAEEFANGEFKMPSKKSSKNKKNQKSDDDSEAEEKLQAQKELELLLEDNEEEKSHFSLKKIQENEEMTSSKKKRKLKKLKKQGINVEEPVDNFELNVQDDRFKAVFSQPEFNIDPTNSGYKKTKGMEKLIQEKLKRRHTDDVEQTEVVEKKKKIKDVSLNLLVKNIKKKVGK
ncbi:ESF1 homolog [Chironomus tepperi]|uniref:ESF1 homolog n=1 Tax=Chironomus tepperi TaxID=113505 RepID=UPI00391F1AA8